LHPLPGSAILEGIGYSRIDRAHDLHPLRPVHGVKMLTYASCLIRHLRAEWAHRYSLAADLCSQLLQKIEADRRLTSTQAQLPASTPRASSIGSPLVWNAGVRYRRERRGRSQQTKKKTSSLAAQVVDAFPETGTTVILRARHTKLAEPISRTGVSHRADSGSKESRSLLAILGVWPDPLSAHG